MLIKIISPNRAHFAEKPNHFIHIFLKRTYNISKIVNINKTIKDAVLRPFGAIFTKFVPMLR